MTPSTDQARDAWQQYASTGRIAADLLRPPVYHAWERAHCLGARPDQFEAQALGPRDTEQLLARENELLMAARPFMAALSQAAGQERHAAMLGSCEGIVLDVVGDEQTVHGPEPFPGPGSLLSEAVTGSNGIGTPLAEGDYAQLVGPEHFIGGFHVFTCQGIPIHDGGRTIGVLSTSVRRVAASNRLHDILVCAAHGIEAEVLYLRLQRDVQRVLSAQPGDAQVLEELRQDIVQSHAAARLKVQAAAKLLTADQPSYAQQLLGMAQEAIGQFRYQATLWQELATNELGTAQPLALLDLVRGMADLLRTEITTHRVQLVMRNLEAVTVQADRRQLLRELLRGFLRAFAAAGAGGAVVVDVRPLHSPPQGQVILLPQPSAGTVEATPATITLAYPSANGGALA